MSLPEGIAVAAGLAGIVTAYWTRQLLMLQKASSPQAPDNSSAWRTRWPLFVIVGLIVLTWAGIAAETYLFRTPPELGNYILTWGEWPSDAAKRGEVKGLQITVDGTALAQRYGRKYRLAAVAFDHAGRIDWRDRDKFQLSHLYDIENRDQMLVISPDAQFLKDVKIGKYTIDTVLLLVPTGVALDQFKTLRPALALGVLYGGRVNYNNC